MQLHVKVHNDLDHLRGSLEDHWIQDGRGTLQTIRQRVANEKPATPGSETQRSHERGSPGARSVHHSQSPASISGSFRGKGQWKPEAVVEKDPLMWTLATVQSITEYQENPKGRHFIQFVCLFVCLFVKGFAPPLDTPNGAEGRQGWSLRSKLADRVRDLAP